MKTVKRPDTEAVLRGLKDFQLKTVDYVFKRLYVDKHQAKRFLIADEVGLGKTLIARGLIAKAIDRLWAAKIPRIDVVYICSNADIARQNINRLNVTGGEDFEIASRITLLPIYLKELKKNSLNFISFTPGTSFELKSSMGNTQERALLYWLLQKSWKLRGKGPVNVLQGLAGTENFRRLVKNFTRKHEIDESLAEEFAGALDRHIKKAEADGTPDIRSRFDELCERFSRTRIHIPRADLHDRLVMVGELRSLLASTCLLALEPDLIILDEFQRFKHLLDGTDKASDLARGLFEFEGARLLLLSATPYKMYTLSHEAARDDHYKDFVRTVKFLHTDLSEAEHFESLLGDYRKELFRIGWGDDSQLLRIKGELESKLRQVMVRTEKLASSEDREGMLKTVHPAKMRLLSHDISDYLSLQAITRLLDQMDTLEYWKSAPYLMNFMEGYKIKNSLTGAVDPHLENKLAKIVNGTRVFLNWNDIMSYKQVDPGNARMRALLDDTVGKGAWRLLWVPPSMPYYQLGFPYSLPELSQFTKRLVFSSWLVVPRAIAGLVSYEAERQAIRSFEARPSNTAAARKRRQGLLRFARKEDRLSGMSVLGLLYPCATLARECDPLKMARGVEKSKLTELSKVLEVVKARIDELLLEILPQRTEAPEDAAWYWAAPILLDLKFDRKTTRQWLTQDQLPDTWSGGSVTESEGEDHTLWAEHVAEAQKLLKTQAQLGEPPADLADVLALLALGGPAITALRSFIRISGEGYKTVSGAIRTSAATVGWSFRHLFNMPESMAVIRGMPGPQKDEPYWRRVLEYATNGCLQATLDEYAHILRESLGLLDTSSEATCQKIAEAMVGALSLRTSALGVDRIAVDSSGKKLEITKERLRAHFAVRFGDEKTDDTKDVSRTKQVQESFNSPFWPYVLATTSVGQEGLDFHHYCHAVVHWNLPSNPVDLEQREGRVHRYKGHAVRKNLAKNLWSSLPNLAIDPWAQVFAIAKAERAADCSDIVPFWVYQIKDGAHIERHVPAIPLSSEQEQLSDLKRSLVVYRMVFGQNAQEDLTSYLIDHVNESEIQRLSEELRINLEPPPLTSLKVRA